MLNHNTRNQLVNITIILNNGQTLKFQEVTANLMPSGVFIEKPIHKQGLLASVNEYSEGRFINLNSIEQFTVIPLDAV